METITKREFSVKYASRRDRRNVRAAAIVTYICAALNLLICFILKDYFMLLDVVLVVGLGLGVHLAKSRACAVVLLVYACISGIMASISTGQLSGWLLILAGVWAVIGTFNLHKDYQAFLQGEPQETDGWIQ